MGRKVSVHVAAGLKLIMLRRSTGVLGGNGFKFCLSSILSSLSSGIFFKGKCGKHVEECIAEIECRNSLCYHGLTRESRLLLAM